MNLRRDAKNLAQAVAADWPVIFGVLVFALGLWAQPAALVGAFYDDGIYAVLAKSLAEGRGFHYIHLPGAPAAVHYPVLYPAALSVLWRIWPSFPSNVALFQVFDCAVLSLAACLLAIHARRWKAPSLVQYVMLPAGFVAFPLLTIVGVRFSEPMFLALAAGAMLATDASGPALRLAAVAGLLAGLATLTRSIGVTIIGGVVLGLWIRHGWRAAAVGMGVAALLVVPWFAWVAGHAGEVDPRLSANYGSYATEASQAGIGAFLAGLDLRALGPPARLVIAGNSAWLRLPFELLLLGALVRGGVLAFPRAPGLVAGLSAYVLMVTVWPYAPDRFMWIVLPWLGCLAGLALHDAWYRGRAWRVVAGGLAAVLCVGFVPREATSLASRSFAATAEGISQPSRLLVPAIQSGTPEDAVIAAEGEALIYLYTGRVAVPNALFRWKGRTTEAYPADSVRAFLCESGVTHVALSGPASDGAGTVEWLLAQAPAQAAPLFSVDRGPSLYRLACRR